jgi:hypothetical protein
VKAISGGNSIATNGALFNEVMAVVENKDADYSGD